MNLRVPGDEGEHVAELQGQLQQAGYYQGELDGQYAGVTETAVRDLQGAYGHSDDGRAGSAVWELFGAGSQAAAGDVEQEAQPGYEADGGQWQWDGTQWQATGSGAQDPAAEPAQVAGAMCEDGQWRWDGTQWLSVNQAGGSAGLELAFSAPDPSDWRDLARRSVPFDQWSAEQKIRANDEYQAVIRRTAAGDISQFDDDREVDRLLAPYHANFRVFLKHIAKAILSVSPEAAKKGERVTLDVDVRAGGTGGKGRVLFKVSGSFGMQILGTKDLLDGRASLSTTSLPQGKLILTAEFPTQTVAGVGEVVGDTSEVRYEVL